MVGNLNIFRYDTILSPFVLLRDKGPVSHSAAVGSTVHSTKLYTLQYSAATGSTVHSTKPYTLQYIVKRCNGPVISHKL